MTNYRKVIYSIVYIIPTFRLGRLRRILSLVTKWRAVGGGGGRGRELMRGGMMAKSSAGTGGAAGAVWCFYFILCYGEDKVVKVTGWAASSVCY